MSIGERIKQARVKAGLTQVDLAAAIGMDPSSVSHWERDVSSPQSESLAAVARALGVTVDSLCADGPAGSSPPPLA